MRDCKKVLVWRVQPRIEFADDNGNKGQQKWEEAFGSRPSTRVRRGRAMVWHGPSGPETKVKHMAAAPAPVKPRDPLTDLFFDGVNNDKGRFMLPPNFPDPESVTRTEARLFGVNTGLGIIIQAAKIKSYVGAMRLSGRVPTSQGGASPPVILAPLNFRGDQADAYAACYWGALLGKFLGTATALNYIVVHEGTQGGQSARERGNDAFNMSFGVLQVFGGPNGRNLQLDTRGQPDLTKSLAGRSVLAAQRRQLRFLGPGTSTK